MPVPTSRPVAVFAALLFLLVACSGQRGGSSVQAPTEDGGTTAAATDADATAGESSDGEGAGAAPVELEFPSWQAEAPGFGDWWQELVAAYQEERPNVSINLYAIPFDGYVDQLVTRFAADDPPEIVHLPSRNFAEFASQGWLEPLDERLASTDILDTWTPLQEEMAWEDSMQGVLLLGYGYVLYYNEQLLNEAGLGVPQTPEEFVAAAQALTTGDVFGFGATTVQAPDNYTEASMFLVGNGEFWTNDDGAFGVTDPQAVAALQQFRDLLAFAPQGVTSEQRVELFNNGQIGLIMDGPFLLPELDGAPPEIRPSLKVARLPFPRVPGGVSNSLHMPAGLDDQTADAVWGFIELAASPEWQQRYTELVQVPAPREGSTTEEAIDEVPELELFGETTEEAVSVYPEDPELRAAFGEFSDAVNEAVIRMTSTDDPTDAVAADLQAKLDGAFGS